MRDNGSASDSSRASSVALTWIAPAMLRYSTNSPRFESGEGISQVSRYHTTPSKFGQRAVQSSGNVILTQPESGGSCADQSERAASMRSGKNAPTARVGHGAATSNTISETSHAIERRGRLAYAS